MDSEYVWTKKQEVALDVFVDFMANILEKYIPIIDDNNDDESKCEDTCSLEHYKSALTIFVISLIIKVGIECHEGGAYEYANQMLLIYKSFNKYAGRRI